MSDRIAGKYDAPLMGVARAPAGVNGEGSLEASEQGLRVIAQVHPTGLMSLFGCLGALVGFVLVGFVLVALRNYVGGETLTRVLGAGLFLGPVFAGLYLGKKAGKQRPVDVTIPWSKVKNGGLTGLTLEFQSKLKPKGMIYFQGPLDMQAALQRIAAMIRAGRYQA
jgi:hypothetical protein